MIICVKAIAGAKMQEVLPLGFDDYNRQIFKVKVNQIAVDGKANQAIIAALSKHFLVKEKHIKIISGETTKNKIIEIKNE